MFMDNNIEIRHFQWINAIFQQVSSSSETAVYQHMLTYVHVLHDIHKCKTFMMG